ncbi:cadherin-7a isoform X1, partial [Tachysurus ichikawai]
SLDFETKSSYTLKIEASNKHMDPRFRAQGPFSDTAMVRLVVDNVDEPPVFTTPVSKMVVSEAAKVGTIIGTVSAVDPDSTNSPIRYSIDRNTDLERFFNIEAASGVISTAKPLDRETNAVHNITILAIESPTRIESRQKGTEGQGDRKTEGHGRRAGGQKARWTRGQRNSSTELQEDRRAGEQEKRGQKGRRAEGQGNRKKWTVGQEDRRAREQEKGDRMAGGQKGSGTGKRGQKGRRTEGQWNRKTGEKGRKTGKSRGQKGMAEEQEDRGSGKKKGRRTGKSGQKGRGTEGQEYIR